MAEERTAGEKPKEAKKIKVKVKVGTLGLNGEMHERGTVIELDKKVAKSMADSGDVEVVK